MLGRPTVIIEPNYSMKCLIVKQKQRERICLTAKNQTLERQLHKLQLPSKIPLFNFDPNY